MLDGCAQTHSRPDSSTAAERSSVSAWLLSRSRMWNHSEKEGCEETPSFQTRRIRITLTSWDAKNLEKGLAVVLSWPCLLAETCSLVCAELIADAKQKDLWVSKNTCAFQPRLSTLPQEKVPTRRRHQHLGLIWNVVSSQSLEFLKMAQERETWTL